MPSTTNNGDVFPPSVKKKKLRATPLAKGSIVTGYSQIGIFGFPTHKQHGLFEILNNPHKAEYSNSGFHQSVRCISCDTIIDKVDCEFLMMRATKAQVQETISMINQARQALLRARRYYSQLIDEHRVK